jgi:hypothetical protein
MESIRIKRGSAPKHAVGTDLASESPYTAVSAEVQSRERSMGQPFSFRSPTRLLQDGRITKMVDQTRE